MTIDDARSGPSVLDYLEILRRRKWVFLLAVVLVPAVAVLLSMREPAVYQASARYLLSGENPADDFSGTPPPYVDATTAARAAQTEAERARSLELASTAIEEAAAEPLSPQEFLESSTVLAGTNADFLTFTVYHSDPGAATRLATEYARAFATYRYELGTRALRDAREATARRLAELEEAGLSETDVYERLAETQAELTAAEALRAPAEETAVQEAGPAAMVPSQARRNAMLGIALGIVLGLGLAFLWETLDTRVRSAGDVRRRLGVRLLGRLRTPPRHLQSGQDLVMTVAPRSEEAEAFRFLRANVESAVADTSVQTIMVTSAAVGQGTSTTVANLAVAFARAGEHVALVDFDLRTPSLHRFFGLDESPGFLDVKLGRVSLGEALRLVSLKEPEGPRDGGANRSVHREGRLEVLPAGGPLSDPDDFGPGLTLEAIIGQLRDRADVVLIDTPGLLSAADPIALSAHVDGVLLVVRLEALRSAALEELARVLASCQAKILGFVVTGAGKARRSRRSARAAARARDDSVLVPLPSRPSHGGTQPAATVDVDGITASGPGRE